MKTITGSLNLTHIIENGERVYPCRCGETHRGEYGIYDYGHHNCLHETDLMGIVIDEKTLQAICPLCGMSWKVNIERLT